MCQSDSVAVYYWLSRGSQLRGHSRNPSGVQAKQVFMSRGCVGEFFPQIRNSEPQEHPEGSHFVYVYSNFSWPDIIQLNFSCVVNNNLFCCTIVLSVVGVHTRREAVIASGVQGVNVGARGQWSEPAKVSPFPSSKGAYRFSPLIPSRGLCWLS